MRHTGIGDRFGRLVVLGRDGRLAMCRCDCGNDKTVHYSNLTGGLTRSCGCLRSETMARIGSSTRKHGHAIAETPEYRAWHSIIQRCTNPNCKEYRHYGLRGITICPEWRNDFQAFLAHVGHRPTLMHSLDRIDNERGYEPGNVRWADWLTQANNRRGAHIVEVDGQRMTLAQAIRLKGQRSSAVRQRLSNGWTLERALTEPVIPRSTRGKRRIETSRQRTQTTE